MDLHENSSVPSLQLILFSFMATQQENEQGQPTVLEAQEEFLEEWPAWPSYDTFPIDPNPTPSSGPIPAAAYVPPEKYVRMVQEECPRATREEVVKALVAHGGDVCDAIVYLHSH